MNPIRSNTILYCQRWAETVKFYRNILQLPVKFENDWFVEFALSETSFVSIADAARSTIDSVSGQGITLSWQVSDIDSAKAELAKMGVNAGPTKTNWDSPAFHIHDPEGHRIEFWESEG